MLKNDRDTLSQILIVDQIQKLKTNYNNLWI